MDILMPIPKPLSMWRHDNGETYTVLMLTNMESDRMDYPKTVVYCDSNGKLYSKNLSTWHRSRKQLPGMATNINPQLVQWALAERIRDIPLVDEAIHNFIEDRSGDNATCMVRDILAAGLMTKLVDTNLEPVEGDLLPPLGSTVLIYLASSDRWVPVTVAGYYVWKALAHQIKEGEKNAHRVFVRVVDAGGFSNARMLSEIRYPE